MIAEWGHIDTEYGEGASTSGMDGDRSRVLRGSSVTMTRGERVAREERVVRTGRMRLPGWEGGRGGGRTGETRPQEGPSSSTTPSAPRRAHTTSQYSLFPFMKPSMNSRATAD